jgi:hypothetical protein
MPVTALMPSGHGINGPQLQPLALGEQQHLHLAMLARGNVPRRLEAFPG